MTTAQIGISVTIVVYLIGMLFIGVWCSKKNNDTGDFYLADVSSARSSPR